ncbi:uncharacterized protein LOC143586311 [Bidens hawaiensis]|uniref:uncharacterized protein LOC143586311 n=1 Tax=Bidens hawaiensis TaxID=980011 RepID=UPI00404A3217
MDRHEWGMIGGDCLVLSCCCQCLVLQIFVFVLLKLPIKVLRKIKVYVKRNFGKTRKAALEHCASAVMGHQQRRSPCRTAVEESNGCMEEVEKVLGEMCEKDEFGFGSFWRGDDDNNININNIHLENDFRICFVNQQLGYHAISTLVGW